MKASTQCAIASTPVAAVTIGGTETVSAGSMIAMSASISTLSVAILFIVAGSVISARVPTSLPVPAVVGICASATAARRRAVRAGDVGQPHVARDEHGDELGEVHRAAAAEADDRVGLGRLGGGDRGLEVRQVGLGLHLAEERGVRQAEDVEAGGVDLVGDDEGAAGAGRVEPGGERLDLAGAEADDRRALHLDRVSAG